MAKKSTAPAGADDDLLGGKPDDDLLGGGSKPAAKKAAAKKAPSAPAKAAKPAAKATAAEAPAKPAKAPKAPKAEPTTRGPKGTGKFYFPKDSDEFVSLKKQIGGLKKEATTKDLAEKYQTETWKVRLVAKELVEVDGKLGWTKVGNVLSLAPAAA